MKKLLFCLFILLVGMMGLTSSILIYAVNETSQPVDVTVHEVISISSAWDSGTDIDLGTLLPDTVTEFSGRETITSSSNIAIKLSTRSSGNFASTNWTIDISQLSFGNYGENVPYTPLSTLYTVVKSNWAAPTPGSINTVGVDYHLTIPVATKPGTYTTTLYHKQKQYNKSLFFYFFGRRLLILLFLYNQVECMGGIELFLSREL